ncbi:ATPase [Silicimonas algicola]|nr:SRPBCC domain-containing protein [Silicimonas algicola]AZQ68892.1 ATPase [Silicimonas algicola]
MTPRVDRAARHVAAEPATAYAAWIDAEALAHWLPPEGASMTVESFVPEPGGALVIVLHFDEATGKTSARTDRVQGRFLELDPPSHLAISVDFDSDDPRFAGTMRMDWTFRPDGAGTEVTVEARDVPAGISPEAHDMGLQSSLANLARYIERT